jgi:hypothetical protein
VSQGFSFLPFNCTLPPYHSVTIRQTLDPYVEDVQYIASYEAKLAPEGQLDLSTIGIKFEPGRFFLITVRRTFHPVTLFLQPIHYDLQTEKGQMSYVPDSRTNIFDALFVEEALSYNPILTIVGTVLILYPTYSFITILFLRSKRSPSCVRSPLSKTP